VWYSWLKALSPSCPCPAGPGSHPPLAGVAPSAAYLPAAGNGISRHNHPQTSALIAMPIIAELGMTTEDIGLVIGAQAFTASPARHAPAAVLAILPNVARDENELLVANALSSSTWAINLAIGSAVGGLIAFQFGRNTVFILNAISFVVSAGLLAMMRTKETHTDHLPPFRFKDLIDFTPILEGIRYVQRDGRMMATMMVKAGMGLLGAHWVILPIMGERVFPTIGSGALSMSLLFGSRGIGALVGSFASGYWAKGDETKMRSGIFWAFVIAAASYATLSIAPTLAPACLCVAIGHAGSSMAWVFSTTMLQGMTEDRFRGRVFSADFGGLFLVMSVVSFAAGQVIDLGLSVRTVALITGILGIAPAIMWWACQRLWKPSQSPLP